MESRIHEDEQGRKHVENPCTEPCAIERGMRILGGKWTGSILWHLQDEPVRFNDLARMVGGASKKMISDRLKHLEAHELIGRQVLDTRPVGVAYFMTERGRTALEFLDALRRWSESEAPALASGAVGSSTSAADTKKGDGETEVSGAPVG